MMTEESTRLNHALELHSHWMLVDGPFLTSVLAMKLMWRMNGNTVKLSATDKLTKIILDAVRRPGNLYNALITSVLPKMVGTQNRFKTERNHFYVIRWTFVWTSSK